MLSEGLNSPEHRAGGHAMGTNLPQGDVDMNILNSLDNTGQAGSVINVLAEGAALEALLSNMILLM